MHLLSRAEEIVLLAILKLKDNAYGVTIRKNILEETGMNWSFGSIYMPLNKLTRKGYVEKKIGSPTSARGGRSTYLYEINEDGIRALEEIRQVQENVWSNVPQLDNK